MLAVEREMLVEMARYAVETFQVPMIVNVGIAAKYGCCSMACLRHGAPGSHLVGIDVEDQGEIPSYLDRGHTVFIIDDSSSAGARWQVPIHLLFIDGDHSREGVERDIVAWTRHVAEGGVVGFHDVNWKGSGFEHVVGVREAVDSWQGSGCWSESWEFVADVGSSRWFRRR